MEVEFHYFMTYLVAARAGLDPASATTLAHASQYVDDNTIIFEVDKDEASAYRNHISQTMNILNPKRRLMRIYPLFHFLPGEPMAPSANRKDGRLHWLNTTPGNKNASLVMDEAVRTGDLYRIGIACHTVADTWAHQNFIGYYDDYNALKGVLEAAAPHIGHANAGHNPDWPGLVWHDRRLLGDAERVDNKARFLEAARCLFERLRHFVDSTCTAAVLEQDGTSLLHDLASVIGERDHANKYRKERIKRYLATAERPEYGNTTMPAYDAESWFRAAVHEHALGLHNQALARRLRWAPCADRCSWKDRATYPQTDWYQFQQAVKAHQDTTWDIVKEKNFQFLDLDEL